MLHSVSQTTLQGPARLAGFLYLAVNAIYIVSLVAGSEGPEGIRHAAVALQATASAATIVMAWAFYEILKPAGAGLALLHTAGDLGVRPRRHSGQPLRCSRPNRRAGSRRVSSVLGRASTPRRNIDRQLASLRWCRATTRVAA